MAEAKRNKSDQSHITGFDIVEKVLKKAELAEFVNGIRKAILLSMLWYSCDI